MRELSSVDEFCDGGDDFLLAVDVFEGRRSVFLDPGRLVGAIRAEVEVRTKVSCQT